MMNGTEPISEDLMVLLYGPDPLDATFMSEAEKQVYARGYEILRSSLEEFAIGGRIIAYGTGGKL